MKPLKERKVYSAKHGGLTRYQYHGCRCRKCVEGYRTYIRQYIRKYRQRERNQEMLQLLKLSEAQRTALAIDLAAEAYLGD